MRIGIVAGEASGDILGAGLIAALRERYPDLTVEGIAGPRMVAAGCKAVYPSERLAVMGLVEILKRYPELRGIRESVKRRFIDDPPDVFIGIDAPDFNLDLEVCLRERGIRTVHYVSPSVWAWREYRMRKIARAVDLMLTFLPFEAEYYERHHVPVRFVGHPLADRLHPPTAEEMIALRSSLGIRAEGTLVALLPGSRGSEVRQLARPFIETVRWCVERHPELHFVVPAATPALRVLIETELGGDASLPVTLIDGRSQEAMAASDLVLLASGTATLEAMLLGKPMVAAYRMSRFSYWFAKALLRIERYTLPNLLAGRSLIPEIIQDEVTPERLGGALLAYLESPEAVRELKSEFAVLSGGIRRGADRQAASAVQSLLSE
ncbi:MAG: lipid-A-disaccharide synthase [Gammaproteobacteria bacterium]|nr:lipid-A-disaccharide synthase [Gammaproteobacteria bacterium]